MAPPHRVLIVCHGVPGTGGGSTCAYSLFRALRDDGVSVRYLTVIEERDEAYYRFLCGADYADPDRLGGTSSYVLRDVFDAPHPGLVAAIAAQEPAVVLAVGDLAATLATRHAGHLPVVLFLTGADELPERRTPLEAKPTLARAIREAQAKNEGALRWSPAPHVCLEPAAAKTAYLVVAPSEAARQVFLASFPSLAGKVHPRPVLPTPWLDRDLARFSGLRRPWAERDVDAIFVANRWRRAVKGLALVERIAVRSRGRSIVIVGENAGQCRGVRSVGLKPSRQEYLGLLGRARVVVCASNFELSSTALHEGIAMGCSVIASPDCGNVAVCAAELVAMPGDAVSFGEKLALALRSPAMVSASPAEQSGDDSYRDLIETLEVVG